VTDARRGIVTDDPGAVLLIRVWFEGGDGAFRARLSAVGLPSDGATVGESTVAVAASPPDVLAAVQEWLDGILRGYETTSGS
jgi:hypothetical protein